MIFKRTNDGWTARLVPGVSPHGHFTLALRQGGKHRIVDEDGAEVGSIEAVLLELPCDSAQQALAVARAEICRACPHAKRVVLIDEPYPVRGVECEKCGCGLLPLVTGKCPAGKWPAIEPKGAPNAGTA